MWQWRHDRKFLLDGKYPDPGRLIQGAFIEKPSLDGKWVYLNRFFWSAYPTPLGINAIIIIAVDGGCLGNGQQNPDPAIGVYVGQNSPYNISTRLLMANPTSQRAELAAGIKALEQAKDIHHDDLNGKHLAKVIIKSDSAYMVKGMTEWIFSWEESCREGIRVFRTRQGAIIKNGDLFSQLKSMVDELNNMRIEVLFWHVRRVSNQDADMLARTATTISRFNL